MALYCYSSPPTTDSVKAFRRQRGLLLSLLRHCSLPSLANSLLAGGLISRGVCELACNDNRGSSERGAALLDCIETSIEAVPSRLQKVVDILKKEPFLREVVSGLVHHYSEYSL